MSFLPIMLGVRRKFDAEKFSGTFSGNTTKRDKILARDDFTCRYCGFRAEKFQKVVPRDWASVDFKLSNLVTACAFCEQCFTLESVGIMGSGLLIWLPEITQAALHHICRAIYVARHEEEGPMAMAATQALDALMARRAESRKRLGSDEPMLLATVLTETLSTEDYRMRREKLDGIRLLPLSHRTEASKNGSVNVFPDMLAYWRSADGPFAELPTTLWLEMLQDVTKTLKRA